MKSSRIANRFFNQLTSSGKRSQRRFASVVKSRRLEALESRQLLSGGSVAATTATVVADTSNYYPNSDTPGNVLTSVAFNESGCLAGVTPSPGATVSLTNGTLGLFYTDETAMTLGVSQVTTITSSGSSTTDYAVSPLNGSPGSVINPEVGAAYTPPTTLGSLPIQAGTDAEGRPMSPSLYVTDITGLDPTSVAAHAGDWQYGGTPVAPNAVYGTWKSVTETINETGATPQISFSVPANPAKNNLDLGSGADAMPAGVSNQGYSAEVEWNLSSLNLQAGHSYRFYFMVHDGDQNKSGGDVGQAAFDLMVPAQSTPCISTCASATNCGQVGSAQLTDSVTISGGDNPTGTVSFTVTQPDGTTVAVGSPVTINGDGTYNASASILATELGTYTFHASYSGDANNVAAVDDGQNESITTVNPPKSTPCISTCASATSNGVVGSSMLSDSVIVSGGNNPTGTVSFTLTQPDGTTISVGSPVTINGDGTYNLSMPVLATEVGTYTFHAVYSGDNQNCSAQDDGQCESVTVISPPSTQIVVTKIADQTSIDAGQTAGFTVEIQNVGPNTATGLALNDPLPAGYANDINWQVDTSGMGYGAGTDAADFVITGSVGHQVSSLAPSETSLAAGATIMVHITGQTSLNDVDPNLAPCTTTLVNTATVTAANLPSNEQDVQATASITLHSADVDITKTADQSQIVAGQLAGYTVTIYNQGCVDATGLTLNDLLPEGSANDIFWRLDPTQNSSEYFRIVGQIGDQYLELAPGITTLQPGQLISVHVIGLTSVNDSGTLNNTATVSASNEPSFEQNAQASASITVESANQNAQQAYVEAAFEATLGRAPDQASLASFVNALDNGMSQTTFAMMLTHSTEYYNDVVDRAYEQYLGRSADAAGVQYWSGLLAAGMTDEQLDAQFIGSAEYYQHAGGTDKAWVDEMYFDLLGRVPDASGEVYWVAALSNGASRSSVALGFAASAEREGDMVKDDYQAFLGRPPIQSEIDGWVMAFENGLTNEDVIAGFVASNEFFQDHS